MSEMEDKLNSLTPEELNALDSDPEMLSAFKSKYAQTAAVAPKDPKFYELEKQPGLPKAEGDNFISRVGNQMGGVAKDLGQSYVDAATNPMPGSLLAAPLQAASKASDELGADVARTLKPHVGTYLARAGGFASSLATNPLTYAGGMAGPEAEAVEGGVPKQGMMSKIMNLFKKSPKPEDIADHVDNVKGMVKEAENKFGSMLNEAKQGLDIPTTVEDKAESIRKYKNAFNLDTTQPLKLPEKPIGASKSFEGPSMLDKYGASNHLKDQLEMWGTMFRDDPELTKQSINTVVDNNTAQGNRTAGAWFKTPEIAKMFKSELISKLEKGEGASQFLMTDGPKTADPMPYTMGEHATPHDLITEIERFKKNTAYIDPSDRAKAASYLQDQINNHVDFTPGKKGDAVQGILKQQYHDLKGVLEDTTTGLQGTKSKMAEVLSTIKGLRGKMDESGQAEAFLRRIANNPTGKNADYLAKLRHLESLTGSETVDDLFNKFADQKGLDLRHPISDSVKYGFEHLGDTLKTGSRVLSGPIGSELHRGFPLSPTSLSQLQSAKDRLHNAK